MPLLLFDMPVDSPGCTNFFFFEVAVCAFINSLFFFLFSFFKATFTFSSFLYYCLTCRWTVPDAPTFFFKVELCALYIWLYFSKPIFFLLLLFFHAFILHALGSPGCTNFFFSIRFFFPFNWLFFFKVIGFWLLLTGFFQSHELIKDGTLTFLRSGCNRLIRMDSMKREVHNCVLYSD